MVGVGGGVQCDGGGGGWGGGQCAGWEGGCVEDYL